MPDTLAQKVRAKYPGAYDDLSDADLESKVTAKYPGVYSDVPRSSAGPALPADAALPGVLAPSTAAGDPHAPTTAENLRHVLEWGGKALAGAFGMSAPGPYSPGREAVEHPGTTLATAAISAAMPAIIAAAPKVPGIVARGLGISAERGGQNIQAATKAASGATVNTEAAGQNALRMTELQSAGATMPRAATRFLQRVTDPAQGDLTFEEARDFYSNLSRLSANEYGRLTPTMQRQLGGMTKALHQALVASAETVGAGEQYQQGMSEFAKASRAAARWEQLKPALMQTLRWATGVGAGASAGAAAYRALTD
jgi:polyhydroxyalkanoate synthesis regulator phasin